MDDRLKKRIIRDKARCTIREIIKGQIYAWPPSVDKAEFKLMVAQGTSQQEIGKRFGKTQPQISRLMRQLTPKDLYDIVMTRPPTVTMPVKVKSLGPTDIVEEVMGVVSRSMWKKRPGGWSGMSLRDLLDGCQRCASTQNFGYRRGGCKSKVMVTNASYEE